MTAFAELVNSFDSFVYLLKFSVFCILYSYVTVLYSFYLTHSLSLIQFFCGIYEFGVVYFNSHLVRDFKLEGHEVSSCFHLLDWLMMLFTKIVVL